MSFHTWWAREAWIWTRFSMERIARSICFCLFCACQAWVRRRWEREADDSERYVDDEIEVKWWNRLKGAIVFLSLMVEEDLLKVTVLLSRWMVMLWMKDVWLKCKRRTRWDDIFQGRDKSRSIHRFEKSKSLPTRTEKLKWSGWRVVVVVTVVSLNLSLLTWSWSRA